MCLINVKRSFPLTGLNQGSIQITPKPAIREDGWVKKPGAHDRRRELEPRKAGKAARSGAGGGSPSPSLGLVSPPWIFYSGKPGLWHPSSFGFSSPAPSPLSFSCSGGGEPTHISWPGGTGRVAAPPTRPRALGGTTTCQKANWLHWSCQVTAGPLPSCCPGPLPPWGVLHQPSMGMRRWDGSPRRLAPRACRSPLGPQAFWKPRVLGSSFPGRVLASWGAATSCCPVSAGWGLFVQKPQGAGFPYYSSAFFISFHFLS